LDTLSRRAFEAVTAGDYDAPEREAAFFYGLFLRGYPYQQLRQDIEVPPEVVTKWQRAIQRDPEFASVAGRVLSYRRRVLAIFKSLISAEGETIH
jgi:hypothetical protein